MALASDFAPTGHTSQYDPVSVDTEPTSHASHRDPSSLLRCPSPQTWSHESAPGEALARPPGHVLHADSDKEPTAALNFPAAQSSQLDAVPAPVALLHFPTPH